MLSNEIKVHFQIKNELISKTGQHPSLCYTISKKEIYDQSLYLAMLSISEASNLNSQDFL